jgi:hypothetical protein
MVATVPVRCVLLAADAPAAGATPATALHALAAEAMLLHRARQLLRIAQRIDLQRQHRRLLQQAGQRGSSG